MSERKTGFIKVSSLRGEMIEAGALVFVGDDAENGCSVSNISDRVDNLNVDLPVLVCDADQLEATS